MPTTAATYGKAREKYAKEATVVDEGGTQREAGRSHSCEGERGMVHHGTLRSAVNSREVFFRFSIRFSGSKTKV